MTELTDAGFPTKFQRMRLVDALQLKYPNIKWDKVYLLRGRYAQQKRLERGIQRLFPVSYFISIGCQQSAKQNIPLFKGVPIVSNARMEGGVVNPETGQYLELDIFLPSLNVAFEFHVLTLLSLSLWWTLNNLLSISNSRKDTIMYQRNTTLWRATSNGTH